MHVHVKSVKPGFHSNATQAIKCKWKPGLINLQVAIMIAVTWVVPAGVFFTSIIGWQYFVGKRTVPPYRCYVQYMENALFNCILQVLAIKHFSQSYCCSRLPLLPAMSNNRPYPRDRLIIRPLL